MTRRGTGGPPTGMDMGERAKPPELAVFHNAETGDWACLVCWTPPCFPPETCDARHDHGGVELTCTREPGHDGVHAACGPGRKHHPLLTWR